jgi:hypothetical protein
MLRARARSAQQRIALARRHGLREFDSHRLTSLELAGMLYEIGRLIAPEGETPHPVLGGRYLESVGLHEVASLVVDLGGLASEPELLQHLRPFEAAAWRDADPELMAILRYIQMTTDDDGSAISLPERRSILAARHGGGSDAVSAFDRRVPDALVGQRMLTFGRERRAS